MDSIPEPSHPGPIHWPDYLRFSTDHKVIGVQYAVMIFLGIIPFNAGLSNYLVPLMIGAKDIAFPLLNALSFWLIPPAGVLLIASFLLPNGPAQAGWWSYPPVSLQAPSGQLVWIISLILLGISSIMGAVNFVTTIVWSRAPGMTFFRMLVFVWSVLSAQLLQLINLPSLTFWPAIRADGGNFLYSDRLSWPPCPDWRNFAGNHARPIVPP